MVNVITGGIVCADCILFIANNDLSGLSDSERFDWQQRVARFDATENGRWTIVPDGIDHGFGQGCDYCDTPLWGDLYGVSFIENN